VQGDVVVRTKFICFAGERNMKKKLSKLGEVAASLGAATLVGWHAFQYKRKEKKPKEIVARPHHITLCSSLITAGLALRKL